MNDLIHRIGIIALLLVGAFFLPAQAQKGAFNPQTPGVQYWKPGTTFYTETGKLSLDFTLTDKKVKEIYVLNAATQQESILPVSNLRCKGEVLLQEGVNTLTLWAKKKSRFNQQLRIFYNPYKGTGSDNVASCEISLYGKYHFIPQVGSNDVYISRYNKENFPLNFRVSCCMSNDLKVTVENPWNQPVATQPMGENLFSFEAQLGGYENIFTIRAQCKGQLVAERRIVVKVDREVEHRLDTAVIFAVSKHDKIARKLGWVDLKYSQEDAEALKWTLENKFGFRVSIITDPTWEQINNSLIQLKNRRWNKLDQLMIFFSGHGHRDLEGTGYLIPSNAGESIKTYYKMEDLRAHIDQMGCNNISLGIDACFASTFLERGGRDMPVKPSKDLHHLLSSDEPFRYFIGSAPSNKQVKESGIYVKEDEAADGNYRYLRKKFKVSAFMMSFLEAIEIGEAEYKGGPIPVWYLGRKVEELYRPS